MTMKLDYYSSLPAEKRKQHVIVSMYTEINPGALFDKNSYSSSIKQLKAFISF